MLDSKEVLNLFTGNLSLRDPITIGSDELETPFDAEKERIALDLILSIIKEIPGAYINNFIVDFNSSGYGVIISRQYDPQSSEIVGLKFKFDKKLNQLISVDFAIRLMLRSFYNFISVPCLI